MIIIFLILGGTAVMGQPYLGLFGGITSSKLTGDAPDRVKYKRLIGFQFGTNLDFKLSKSIMLGLQPSFAQEGTRLQFKVKGVKEPVDSIKVRLNYFAVPVVIKVSSTNQRFYAIGGIEGAYIVGSYLERGGKEEDLKTDISEFNLSVHFGAGIRIPLGFPRLYIEIRYVQGVLNLTDEPIDKSYIPRIKTNGIKLNLGLEIPLSNK